MKTAIAFACTAAIVLSACETTSTNRARSLDETRDFDKQVIDATLNSITDREIISPASISQTRRNSIIQARLAEIDVLYYKYEKTISRDVRQGNFGFSVAEILIGGAGSVASGGTSQGLSAVSAALSGTQSAYNKDILLDQSLQAFITQMRANRAAVKSRIVARFDAPTHKYTLQMALSDLAAYEQAGTLAAALAGINESAQEKEKEESTNLQIAEDEAIEEIVSTTPQAFGIHGRGINDYFVNGSVPASQQERYGLLDQCYKSAVGSSAAASVSLGEFVVTADSAQNRAVSQSIKQCMETRFKINIL